MNTYKLVLKNNVIFDITEDEYLAFIRKMQTTGGRFPYFKLNNGSLVFMNNILTIIPLSALETKPEPAAKDAIIEPEFEEIKPEPVKDVVVVPDEPVAEEPTPSLNKEQRDKEEMAEMIAKSNCTHKEVSLHFQVTKKGTRYFPVCDFCGHRGRYIASAAVTEEEAANAIAWEEK